MTYGCKDDTEALSMQNEHMLNAIDDVFFDLQCLQENCYVTDVAGFMDYVSSDIRFESIVGTELCLLLLFLLLQLGGIPNPRNDDEDSYTVLGSFIWFIWMLFVLAQFMFTFLSLIMAVLATFAMVGRYSTCFVRYPSGGAPMGAGVGAGVGGFAGVAMFVATKALAESEWGKQSIFFLVLSAMDRRLTIRCVDKFYGDDMATLATDTIKCVGFGALFGLVLGGGWGYATSGASLFGAVIPSLLWSPIFLGKVIAMVAHLFTFSQGLVAAGFSIDPDNIVQGFAFVVVLPAITLGLFYWILSASMVFSILTLPLTLCMFVAVRAIFSCLLKVRNLVVSDDKKEDARATLRKQISNTFHPQTSKEGATAKREKSLQISKSLPSSSPPLVAGAPAERAFDVTANRLLSVKKMYSLPITMPLKSFETEVVDLETGGAVECSAPLPNGGAPASTVDDNSPEDDDHDKAAMHALELKIRTAIQESGLKDESVRNVLKPLFEAYGGDVEISNFLEQAFWWLPATLGPSVKKLVAHDCTKIRNTFFLENEPEPEGGVTILRIILYSSFIVCLIPCIVLGSWVAYYSFLQKGWSADVSFITTCYKHFFQLFWTLASFNYRVPSVFNVKFNLTKQLEIAFQAFLAAPAFDTAPPLLLLDGSKGFAFLSFATAVAKPLVSALAELFVAFQALPKNKMVAEVALASADFSSVIHSHSAKATHAELVNGLKTKGLDVSRLQQSHDGNGFVTHFVVPNQQKFSVDLEVFETGNFMDLEELHLGGCVLVMGELKSLATQCGSLKDLNLSGCHLHGSLEGLPPTLVTLDLSKCKQLSGSLNAVAAVGSSLQSLKLSGCAGLTGTLQKVGHLSNLGVLDLSYCTGLRKGLNGLESCLSLQTLVLAHTSLSGTLEPLKGLPQLAVLDCRGASKLKGNVHGLGECARLHTVLLGHCTSLTTSLEGLGSCKALEKLDLTGVELDGSVKPLLSCKELKELILKDCQGIKGNLSNLCELRSLRVLDVSFTKIRGTANSMKPCTGLEILNVGSSGVTGVKDFMLIAPNCKVSGDGGLGALRRGFSRRMSMAQIADDSDS
mmetsp:Transcript_29012/g.59317  ORF Transcript_29012/g.59317 Transcript_29012/m.59317 type:complete len:1077 (-) Transcript_29012:449-3679(-)